MIGNTSRLARFGWWLASSRPACVYSPTRSGGIAMRTWLGVLMLGLAAPAVAAPADDLKAVIDEHWAWSMRENPIYATMLGIRDYDAQIPDISLAAEDRRAAQAQALLTRLNAIPTAQLGRPGPRQPGDPEAEPRGADRGQPLRPADDPVQQPQRLAPEFHRPRRGHAVPHQGGLRKLPHPPRPISQAQRRGDRHHPPGGQRRLYAAVRRR